jgi:hypothetical protein
MRSFVVAMAVSALAVAGSAEAKGCLKGAVVGGVAGHFANHHALLGAAAGCAIGHHLAHKHEVERRRAAEQAARPH